MRWNMNFRVVINITVAIAIIGGVFALWESSNSNLQTAPTPMPMQ